MASLGDAPPYDTGLAPLNGDRHPLCLHLLHHLHHFFLTIGEGDGICLSAELRFIHQIFFISTLHRLDQLVSHGFSFLLIGSHTLL